MTVRRNFYRIIIGIFIITGCLAALFFLLYFGSTTVTENLDDYVYELPFNETTKCKVVQGYGGLFTHNHIAALDFEVPVGTPVYAARGGIIYAWKDDSNEGGIFPRYKR